MSLVEGEDGDGLIVEEETGANRRQIEEAKQELRESGFVEVQ